MIDYGFDDLGQGNGWRRRLAISTPVRQTNPIYYFGLHPWRRPAAAGGSRSSVTGRKCEIRDTRHEIRAGRVAGAPNKANFAVFELEIEVPLENKPNLAG